MLLATLPPLADFPVLPNISPTVNGLAEGLIDRINDGLTGSLLAWDSSRRDVHVSCMPKFKQESRHVVMLLSANAVERAMRM